MMVWVRCCLFVGDVMVRRLAFRFDGIRRWFFRIHSNRAEITARNTRLDSISTAYIPQKDESSSLQSAQSKKTTIYELSCSERLLQAKRMSRNKE